MTDFDEIREQLDLLNDEELISILRERDEEQWRPEVFDIVASILGARGVSPATGTVHEKGLGNEPAGPGLIAVGNYFSDQDAESDRLVLEQKGLSAWILHEQSSQDSGSAGTVQLKVFPEDLTAAMAALDSEPVASSALPDDIAEPPCPKCGSRKITERAEIVESFDRSSDLSRSNSREMWFYQCASCGYRWSESYEGR
jgi:hypothetical protein